MDFDDSSNSDSSESFEESEVNENGNVDHNKNITVRKANTKNLNNDKSAISAKRRKKDVKFNHKWKKTYPWLLEGTDERQAKCLTCHCQFSINHGGENDVTKHMKTMKHKLNLKTSSQKKVNSYFLSNKSVEKDLVARAECTLVFHAVEHSHSYTSLDCGVKLLPTIFGDSKIIEKLSCGKTKASKIVTKILAPASRTKIQEDLSNNHPYSLATDASNKGNVKTFPIILRYFKKNTGTCTKLLRFYSANSEKSVDIAKCLVDKLNEVNLSVLNITGYCADNASVNFGRKQSVFIELQKLNKNILPLGCVCHIIHNAAKNGQVALKYDIETIVIKCYNEFSSSTKKVTELKEFYVFCEEEWSELLRSVPTRWLTLVPAVERLLKHFSPIKGFFLSLNSPPPILKKFFEDELAEAYLGLILNVGVSMNGTIALLESKSSLIVELFSTMNKLRQNLILKREQAFYGSIAISLLRKCDDDDKTHQFQKEADVYLEKIINYLEKWYQFEDNKFKHLSCMTLHAENNKAPKLIEFVKLASEFKIEIDEDVLFEEYIQLTTFFEDLPKDFHDLTSDQKWVQFFKNTSTSARNFEKICSFVFSLPHSNAAAERVFSLMATAWRKERNRLSMNTLEAELMVKYNYDMTCGEFAKFLKEEGSFILSKVQSSEKYY